MCFVGTLDWNFYVFFENVDFFFSFVILNLVKRNRGIHGRVTQFFLGEYTHTIINFIYFL